VVEDLFPVGEDYSVEWRRGLVRREPKALDPSNDLQVRPSGCHVSGDHVVERGKRRGRTRGRDYFVSLVYFVGGVRVVLT